MEEKKIVPVERKPTSYNPQMTADTRRSVTAEIVRSHLCLMQRSSKVRLADLEQVQERAEAFMQTCADNGLLPSMEGFAAFCGLNRQWVYEFLQKHPESQSAQYIQSLQTQWVACRINAAERGVTGETLTIFLLKNSLQGFADRLEIAPSYDKNPLHDLDVEQSRKRILAAIPMEDDD